MSSIDPSGVRVTSPVDRPIIFFDGTCVLCNRFADAVLRADVEGVFRFATLQGQTARDLLPALSDDPRVWSVVYLDKESVHRESDAALAVCRRLGGAWRFFGIVGLLPRQLRNGIYRLVARRRYSWFGQRSECRVPDERERGRFLP